MTDLSTKVTDKDRANAWRGVTGILYSADKTRLLAVYENNISRYKIKDGTKVICDFAFDACRYLEEIGIPDSVVKIGNRAFSGCNVDLKKIVIPDSIIEIGAEAFSGCIHIVPGTVCSKKNEVHKFVVHNFVYQHKFCAFSLNYLILCTWGLERCVAFLVI